MLDMDEGAVRWMLKTVRKNFWRVARHYELDDLIQDGYLIYYHVANRYTQVTDRPHLMRLFQTSLTNHIHNLAKQKRKGAFETIIADLLPVGVDENALWNSIPGQDGELAQVIADAPPHVYKLLTALGDIDPERLRAPYRRRKNGGRETYNQRLCRLAGIDPKINVLTELREYVHA